MKKFIKNKLDDLGISKVKKIIEKIEKYDYISFDIFDTLIKRDVPNPTDVFHLIEKKYHLDNFYQNRINAEKNARLKSLTEEVSLENIYEYLIRDSTWKLKNREILEIEKQIEVEICTYNKDMLEIYNYCVRNNKKIIIISDMYLDKMTIENILEKNGITIYDRIYISNELNMTKHSGTLFQYVLQDLKILSNQLVHIGNDIKADYYSARRNGILSLKIPTSRNKQLKKYNNPSVYLDTFINNHTHNKEFYFDFGFERLGPLLYGFIEWLYEEMKKEEITQVFFLARDGHIMKDVYDMLEYNKKIPSYYFEASRRSLRVPYYINTNSMEEVIQNLSIPTVTNMMQIFDSLGLDCNKYEDIIMKHGYDLNSTVLRRDLLDNQFRKLYNDIVEDIKQNSYKEKQLLEKYLDKFHFTKKIAIVDIGWGASMQKYLLKSLEQLNIDTDVFGYYLGLTKKSTENLDKSKNKAKAYLFDNFNHTDEYEKERPFVGLFESLFLEQNGSVKKYIEQNNDIIAERYAYEYQENGIYLKEVEYIISIQEGARAFVKEYYHSLLKDLDNNYPEVMFNNLYTTGISPNILDVNKFGFFVFFNNGNKTLLASPNNSMLYLLQPKKFVKDISNSQWKIGFLKKMLKLPLPYLRIFDLLQKMRRE